MPHTRFCENRQNCSVYTSHVQYEYLAMQITLRRLSSSVRLA